jgi:primosomal protein N'
MMAKRSMHCPDCDVEVGEAHEAECAIARCKYCGKQDISCARCDVTRPSTIWKGVLPGQEEVEQYGLDDIEELRELAVRREMLWDIDEERFIAAEGWRKVSV